MILVVDAVSADLAQMHLASSMVFPALAEEASVVDHDRGRTRHQLIGVTAGRLTPAEVAQIFVIRTHSMYSLHAAVSMVAKVAVVARKQP